MFGFKIVSFSLSYVGLSCRVFKRAFSLLTQCSVANKGILHHSFFVCLSVCLCSTVKNTTATLPVRPAELWSNQLGRFLHDSPVESNAQW